MWQTKYHSYLLATTDKQTSLFKRSLSNRENKFDNIDTSKARVPISDEENLIFTDLKKWVSSTTNKASIL